MKVNVHFSLPRRPESNGLCERENRNFIQNMRILSAQCGSRDWIKLIPHATWVVNSQISSRTGFSPQELFFGRPTWFPEFVVDPESNPQLQDWVTFQLEMTKKHTSYSEKGGQPHF